MAATNLLDLLPEAAKSPSLIEPGEDGSPLVLLGLHCMMVEAGFVCKGGGKGRKGRFVPPPDWNTKRNEWLLEYTRGDAGAAKFTLHASVLNSKMFVKAMQVGREKSSQVLGVQVEIYIRSLAACGAPTWPEAMDNLDRLQEMFQVYVARPLVAAMEAVPEGREAAGGAAGAPMEISELLLDYKVPIAAGLLVLGVLTAVAVGRRGLRH